MATKKANAAKSAKTLAKTSAKTKKLATPKSNVKILNRTPASKTERANANKIMNEASTKKTNDAKSGKTAKTIANSRMEANKRRLPKDVIKIRSGRGGGAGGAFLENLK